MTNIKFYNLYIFISTFTRNIIDIYSVIFLYKNNFPIHSIVGIYTLIYFLGSIISYLSLTIGNKVGYKYILLLSSIITSITFYILKITTSQYIIAFCLSLSIFTYHPIKHYYGLILLNDKQKIGNTLILTYLATFASSYFVIKDLNIIYLIIISTISLIPTFFIKKNHPVKIDYHIKLNKHKYRFFIFDQFKIIFLLLQPLYLYTISKTISYVGVFNIILTISSILCLYILTKKINLDKNYKHLNIIFTIILLIKLNIFNKNILLILALFEGIGIKTNELVSTMNLYNSKKRTGYLIISEIIFCLTRSSILALFFILNINLKVILYILLVGIFILSFQYKKDTT